MLTKLEKTGHSPSQGDTNVPKGFGEQIRECISGIRAALAGMGDSQKSKRKEQEPQRERAKINKKSRSYLVRILAGSGMAFAASGGLAVSSMACEVEVRESWPDIQTMLTQNFNPLIYVTLAAEQAIDYRTDSIDSQKAKEVIDLFLKESLVVHEEEGQTQTFKIPFDVMVEIRQNENGTISLMNPTDFSVPGADENLQTKIEEALETLLNQTMVRFTSLSHSEYTTTYVFRIADRDTLKINVMENYINFDFMERDRKRISIGVDGSLNYGLITHVSKEPRKGDPDGTLTTHQLITQHHSIGYSYSGDGYDNINNEKIVLDGSLLDGRIDSLESLKQFFHDYSDAPEIFVYMIWHGVEKELFTQITDVAGFKSFIEILPRDPMVVVAALHRISFRSVRFKPSDRVEDLIEIIRLLPRDAGIFSQFISKVIGYAQNDNGLHDEFRHPIDILSSGWGDCDDYTVLNYFWAYLQNYNPYVADLKAKESGKPGHVFTWFKNEESRVIVLDNASHYLLDEGKTVEDYFAIKYQEKMVLKDAYIQAAK